MKFLSQATRNLFFTGKGGVGKTSLACATAIGLADRGKRVLLVSTDPASNLDEVLGVSLGSEPTAIADVPGLCAMNLDADAAAREYRERLVGPYRGVLPDTVVASMEEQLSGSCTVEIAAFDEFSRLLADADTTAEFDHVVFDTAPTGHTLRLLSLPAAWSGFIDTNTSGASCLGPLAGLQAQHQLYKDTVRALSDAQTTTLVLVTRPEPSALAEAARSSGELADLDVQNQHLVINAVFHSQTDDDPIAQAWQRRGQDALASIPEGLNGFARTELPLAPYNLVGISALRAMLDGGLQDQEDGVRERPVEAQRLPLPLVQWIDQIAAAGRGAILTMGKGGVGKTTIAAAIAVELARRGHRVHLTTTDPAAHVMHAVGQAPARLTVDRIDPRAETEAYRAEVMASMAADLDVQGRALLEEDLRSPCTEEIAVFRAFARAVDQGQDGFVVLDTAPTGHTILLLDATLAYHRELSRQSTDIPDSVQQLLPRLRDPDFTRVLLVTLPEATPVHEAAQLQDDLVRAGIRPFGWVINQSLAPLPITDPVLLARQHHEGQYIREVVRQRASRTAIVPWLAEAPVGAKSLAAVVRGARDERGSGVVFG
ncbi:MAG: arsenical pump-driving ATPase [Planctomycetaceae bacterium]|nr:MAG: arsenical pump-driving ATPase [Planctomycetaceae bacterium]